MTETAVTYCNSSAIHSNNTVVGVLSHAPTSSTNDSTANHHNKNYINAVGACDSTPTEITNHPTFVTYDRKSYRHNGHDYDGGIYFITICTKNARHHFGKISNGEMKFTSIGKYANEIITDLQSHHPYCEPIQWQIMPNHIHAIISINPDAAILSHTPDPQQHAVGACDSTPKKPFRITPLGTVVCCLKSAVTTYARKNNIIDFAWQPRYHDRIIRNMYEASRISDYIRDNVAKWDGKIECHETIMKEISHNNEGILLHTHTKQNMTQIS